MASGRFVGQRPDGPTPFPGPLPCVKVLGTGLRMAIHFFVNFDIFKWLYLSYYWVYLHQTWGFCKTWSTLYDYVDQ